MNIKLPFLTINLPQNAKEVLQLLLTATFAFGYVYLVATKKASAEGFIVLATYIVKKFLDIIEENKEVK